MEKQQGKSGLLLDLSLNRCIFDKTPPPPLLEWERGDQEGRGPGLPARAAARSLPTRVYETQCVPISSACSLPRPALVVGLCAPPLKALKPLCTQLSRLPWPDFGCVRGEALRFWGSEYTKDSPGGSRRGSFRNCGVT